jgi:hypothetical protein
MAEYLALQTLIGMVNDDYPDLRPLLHREKRMRRVCKAIQVIREGE